MPNEQSPLAYDEQTTQVWLDTVNAWPWQERPNGEWIRSGLCPRCNHAMERMVRAIPIFSFEEGTEKLAAPEEVDIACNCSMPHESRPSGKRGCGQAGVFPGPSR